MGYIFCSAQPSLTPEIKGVHPVANKKSLSPEARAIINSQISRRAVLAGLGGVAGATALAACGGGGSSSGAAADTVRWANWTLYLDIDE